jgi:hypothetical protein
MEDIVLPEKVIENHLLKELSVFTELEYLFPYSHTLNYNFTYCFVRIYSTNGRDENCTQSFSWKTRREEAIWKT